jgi:hypothetical protein
MSNEVDELHPDQQLALAVERGEVTKEQVAEIWHATEDLPATTPIETRKAVIAIRKAGAGHDPIEAMALAYPHFMRFVMDSVARTEAALTKDESKFAHLVAHTDDVVRELQKVGPITSAFQDLRARHEFLTAKLERIEALLTKPKWWQFWKIVRIPDEGDADERASEMIAEEPYDPRIASPYKRS